MNVAVRMGSVASPAQSHQRRGLRRMRAYGTTASSGPTTRPSASDVAESDAHLPSVWFDNPYAC
jgi:hypothetical protein